MIENIDTLAIYDSLIQAGLDDKVARELVRQFKMMADRQRIVITPTNFSHKIQ
ncbi:MAG: hypothetical protein HON23_00785 [Rickettsiales bacterium]|jgi:hypothetical protein|nr:hypothetical protein [Rickettsiales bacterium]